MEISHAMNGRQMDSKKNFDIQSIKKTKNRITTVKMERSVYSSRVQKRPCMA
jgi:hypothetical protein